MKHPKNYTILLKEIKESLNQLKSILVLELEDSLLLIFPKENCRLNWITKKKKKSKQGLYCKWPKWFENLFGHAKDLCFP